ncbi:MAG: hypothetical protein R3D25_13700 [Geminicoccaceae bacterium]
MPASRDTSVTPVEIIPPNGRAERPERRQGAASFRPYAAADSPPPGSPPNPAERRERRRSRGTEQRGRRVDILS